jgi:hypothetical protein
LFDEFPNKTQKKCVSKEGEKPEWEEGKKKKKKKK